MSIRFSIDFNSYNSSTPSPRAPMPISQADVDAFLESVRDLPDSDEADGKTLSETNLADSIFIPEGYEPNYAYPLIVWITHPGDDKAELHRRMSEISTRNYFGIALCAPEPLFGAATDDTTASEADYCLVEFEEQLFDTVSQLRQDFHLHTERVFLAGFGTAGTLALRLGLHRPEWFAGVAAFAGQFPDAPHVLSRFRDLQGKRVLLGRGRMDSDVSLEESVQTTRLLHAAGLRVCHRTYEAGHEITRTMLAEIDRWVMREILSPVEA